MFFYAFFLTSALLLASCDKKDLGSVESDSEKYTAIFNSKYVLTSAAFISGEPRTVDDGMPVIFEFKYNKLKKNEIIIKLTKFSYGNMPLTISFNATAELLVDRDNESAKRVVLHAKDAFTQAVDPNSDGTIDEALKGNSKLNGYYYPESDNIELFINFNMMNVTLHSKKQKLDTKRIDSFDVELEDYNRRHKEQNG